MGVLRWFGFSIIGDWGVKVFNITSKSRHRSTIWDIWGGKAGFGMIYGKAKGGMRKECSKRCYTGIPDSA